MSAGRRAYTTLLWLALPLIPLRLAWRARRQPAYLDHVAERFGRYGKAPSHPVIWIHAVSVGETRAAAPLVERLLERYPDHRILLTHMTPTGREAGRQLFGDRVLQRYLPYDYPFAVRRFLGHFRPRAGLLMETELWFNLIAGCKAAGVPLYLVNARLSERSYRRYARFSRLAAEALGDLNGVLAQTAADAERLSRLGARRVEVAGNLKFDLTPPPPMLERGRALRALFGCERPVFLAASTREGEEARVLDAVARVNVPGLLTVIVPRHPQRFGEVAALIARRGLRFQRRSEDRPVAPGTQVVLGDSMGELFAYYAACDVAFVGGSLLPLGGQNLIEACAVGAPVLIGPHTFNFEEAARRAVEEGAALRVADEQALARAVAGLLTDAARRRRMAEAALAFAERHRGAAERVLARITSDMR
ncbi:MAG: 3-deoxy-D-manno-octulosonic acid transferase [Azospira oryzae]|nr:MAG: 3-deoxy-D-manno-octulosonic acid transferase [Azospira oryzae]PZP80973.1 MAG: 3-deoxy-D-manno-octulosonic acid transferase [Azospira oryzae]